MSHQTGPRIVEATEQNEANWEKVHRYDQRWEGSYKSAVREIRMLQTDRAIQEFSNQTPPDEFAPLAYVPKIHHFARRIGRPPLTVDDNVRHVVSTQPANPTTAIKSTTCETKSPTEIGLADEALASRLWRQRCSHLQPGRLIPNQINTLRNEVPGHRPWPTKPRPSRLPTQRRS
ncbi:MAG: hypothetical protein IT168_12165 [Bryobacterales bacterium]|nr:hypothetical protein [Bryobacterales bacterium]